MSATDTALRVLAWVRDGAADPLPTGDLADAHRLGSPSTDIRDAVAAVTAVTQARLRLRPFSTADVVGTSVALIAAAVGGRHDPGAVTLLNAATAPHRLSDMVAHHGVVGGVLARADDVPDTLTDALRDLSPLTGILDRPRTGRYEACLNVLEDFAGPDGTRPDVRLLVTLTLAEPARGPEQWRWRAEILDSLRLSDLAFVLDVYEAARRFHGPAHDAAIARAQAHLRPPRNLAAARPVAEWWRPLSDINFSEPDEIRRRIDLVDLRPALRLVKHLAVEEGS